VDDKGSFLSLLFVFLLAGMISAQELPPDELQVNFSGYFDSFNVNVIYPNFALTRKISDKTSINGRYLVDMITAASIKGGNSSTTSGERESEFEDDEFDDGVKPSVAQSVDAVTAASSRGGGGVGTNFGGPAFDDVRQEFNLGVTQILAGNRISVNGLYSTETDYTSKTLAGTISRDFWYKNTTVELGFVRSWDRVFPVTKDWTRDKNVVTYSANFSQILGKSALIQLLSSYIEDSGYLADAYNQIRIGPESDPVLYDPIQPGNRIRRAVGSRFKFRLNSNSSMQLGYRYYWDSWDVNSHTISADYMKYLNSNIILDLGWRYYLQSRASFFKPVYTQPEPLMSADIKLDKGYSNELQLGFILNGGPHQDYLPFLTNEKVQYNFSLNFYQRHTQSGYWFNGSKNLFATNFNIGLRYRF
jgi:hypothetical protein